MWVNSSSCTHNQAIYREMVDLEIASTFSFQERWLADTAPHILTEQQRELVEGAKRRAERRVKAEARIPKHLLYTKGWPTCMPTSAEAVLLAEVRYEVAEAVGLEIGYTDPERILERYAALMAANERKNGTSAEGVMVQEVLL